MTTDPSQIKSLASNQLWYDRPATYWTEALPLGNGRLGVMVFGAADVEHIQFNEESLWSGYPRDHTNPDARQYLPKVREAVFAGQYDQADRLVRSMQGPYTQSYLPFGDVHLEFPGKTNPQEYRRWLDLDTAVHHTTYRLGDLRFARESFVSTQQYWIQHH